MFELHATLYTCITCKSHIEYLHHTQLMQWIHALNTTNVQWIRALNTTNVQWIRALQVIDSLESSTMHDNNQG